jgi:hypothetical protein
MTALRGWCTSPSATANPPFQSRQAQLESGVRGNVPAPFGAGERLQSPTYRYPIGTRSLHRWLNAYRGLAFFPPPKSVKQGLYTPEAKLDKVAPKKVIAAPLF